MDSGSYRKPYKAVQSIPGKSAKRRLNGSTDPVKNRSIHCRKGPKTIVRGQAVFERETKSIVARLDRRNPAGPLRVAGHVPDKS